MGREYVTNKEIDPRMIPYIQAQVLYGLFGSKLLSDGDYERAAVTSRVLTVRTLIQDNSKNFFDLLQIVFSEPYYLRLSQANGLSSSEPSGSPFTRILETHDRVESSEVYQLKKGNAVHNLSNYPRIPELHFIPSLQTIADFLIDNFWLDSTLELHQKSLVEFIARNAASSTIKCSEKVVEDILEYYFAKSSMSSVCKDTLDSIKEIEKLLIALLKSHPIKKNKDAILSKAKSTRYLKVIEFLYKLDNNYIDVFYLYLNDRSRVKECYAFLDESFEDVDCPMTQKSKLKKAIMENIQLLIHENSSSAASFINKVFVNQAESILSALDQYPEIQFQFLHSLFSDSLGMSKTALEEQGLLFILDSHVQEKYISLLCQFRKNDVYTYLISNENYNVEKVMVLCKRYKIYDATSYLLERTGDLHGALKLMLHVLRQAYKKLFETLSESEFPENNSLEDRPEYLTIVKRLDVISHLIERCSHRKDPKSKELWFSVLEFLCQLYDEFQIDRCPKNLSTLPLQDRDEYSNCLNASGMLHRVSADCISIILIKAVEFIEIKDLLEFLSSFASHIPLSDLKEALVELLEVFSLDLTILSGANDVFQSDIFSSYRNLTRLEASPLNPSGNSCCACSRSLFEIRPHNLDSFSDRISIFECGHAYHAHCTGADQRKCLLCHSTQKQVSYSFSNTYSVAMNALRRATIGKKALISADSGDSTKSTGEYFSTSPGEAKSTYQIYKSLLKPTTFESVDNCLSSRKKLPKTRKVYFGFINENPDSSSVEEEFQLKLNIAPEVFIDAEINVIQI